MHPALTRRRRRPWLGALLLVLSASSAMVRPAAAQCLPGMCGFSESGKKGPVVRTIDTGDLAKNDALLAKGTSTGAPLAAASVNRGELFGAGLVMPQTEARLGEMLERLAKRWPYRPVGNLRVRIVASNEISPLSFADGVIVVPFALLSQARSDDVVAWLMAHEFSHIALAHFAGEIREGAKPRAIDSVVSVVDLATAASQVRVAQNGDHIRLYDQNDPAAQARSDAIWARGEQLKGAMRLMGAAHTRKDEDRADALGFDLLISAEYSANGAGDALDMIAAVERNLPTLLDRFGQRSESYLEKSGAKAADAALKGGDLNTIGSALLKDAARNVVSIGLNEVKKSYLASHRPATQRIEGLRSYQKRAWNDAPGGAMSRSWLKTVRAEAEFVEANTAITAHGLALAKLDEEKPAEAKVELAPALATRYGTTPIIANLSARIARAQGDLHTADLIYSRVEKLPSAAAAPVAVRRPAGKGKGAKPVSPAPPAPPPPVSKDAYLEQNLGGFQDHVDLLVKMHSYPKALLVIGEAKKRFGDDQAFLHNYIAIYAATNQTDLWAATMERCGQATDPTVLDRCRGAMLNDAQQQKLEAMAPADRARLESAMARQVNKPHTGFLERIAGGKTKD